MKRVTQVKPGSGYRIEVAFENGLAGTIDLSLELYGPMFEPLRDPELFNQVRIDEFGVICWPNGADLAPEFVYGEIRRQSTQLSAR
jgi:hypothetical protein